MCLRFDSVLFVYLRLELKVEFLILHIPFAFPNCLNFSSQTFDRIFQDYSETWWIILIGLAVSMIISLFWIVLMRFAAGFMVWLSILAILALQGFGKF